MSYKVTSLYSGAGIIVTYKCTAACLHCCYSSSPQRDGAYMSRDTADNIFALLSDKGCRSVHIGGGEPFMNFDALVEVCKSAMRHRVVIDYIETNASWYTDDKSVTQKLEILRDAGVDCLLISLDPFHNEFIPYAKVKKLIKCCQKNNFATFLWQSRFDRIISKFDENSTHSLEEYTSKFGADFVESIANSYGINYNGRAIRILETPYNDGNPKRPAEYLLDKSDNCSSKLSSLSHCHIDLNGDFIPPGCIGFKISLFDLCGDGLDEAKYANFLSVVNGGFNDLYKRAIELGFTPNPDGYVSKCKLCFDVKQYISEKNAPYDIGPIDFFKDS